MARTVLSSLNLLRAFEAAARLGSFKAAADELCVTPSAISQQVKALEAQLGVALFERLPRALVLTEAGRRYAGEIRPHLAALDDASRRLRESRAPSVLRVTLMPPLARRVVLPRLADFQAAHPAVDLRLDTGLRTLDLQQRQVDLAVRYGTPPWPGCVHRKLADLYAQPICPPAVAAAYDLAAHPERLPEAPLVHMTERPETWPQFFALRGWGPPRPAREYHVDDYPAAIEAAETLGAALAVLPLEQPLLASGRVVAVGDPVGPLPEAMYAVMLAERRDDPAIAAFLDWLGRQLDTLVAGG